MLRGDEMQSIEDHPRGEAAVRASLERFVVDGRLQGENLEHSLDSTHELQRLVGGGSDRAG